MTAPLRGDMSERKQHEMVADALAAVRLYHRHYASVSPAPERIAEIVEILKAAGKEHDAGRFGSILTTASDAISKTYLQKAAG